MVKLTGSEWNRFYFDAEAWPDGAWHEGEEITMDGEVLGDDFDFSAVQEDEERQCSHCKATLFLSAVRCECDNGSTSH